jgi:hypothetical protein
MNKIYKILLSFALFCLTSTLLAKPTYPESAKFSSAEYAAEEIAPTETIVSAEAAAPETAPPPTAVITNESCNQMDGAIDLSPDPWSIGPFQFLWSNGAQTEDIDNLEAGTYTVTVIDGDFNIQIETFTVGVVDFGPVMTGVATPNNICNGGNGSINVTMTVPFVFTYEWSNGETTEDINNLPAGDYTLTVTFNGTCTASSTFTVNENAPVPFFTFMQDTARCELANGSLVVFMPSGPGPHTYQWSNGVTTQMNTNIPAGDYEVTVTDANGCTATGMTTLENRNLEPQAEGIEVQNTTCIGANGSINITVSPAAATFTYQWSNGATTEDISGLSAGLYYVTITRSPGGACFGVYGYFINNEPILPNLAVTNYPSTCGNSNGAATLSVFGNGLNPFTYLWSGGQTTQNLSNQPAGEYTVTVTGNNGCTTTATAIIDDTQVPYTYNATITDHIACDTTNGRIVLMLSPSNLTVTWWDSSHTTIQNNLAPGDYAVTISAGGTCTTEEVFTVADLTEYPSIPGAPTNSTCGLSNGAINLTVNGGQEPFTYLWSNGATTEDLTGLAADTFFVTVTSDVGCSAVNMIVVPNRDTAIVIQALTTDNLSCASPTGSVLLDVTPVDSTLVFAWNTGDSIANLANLAAGAYSVTVSLGATCISSATFVITDDALPPNLSAAGIPAECGFSNGAADLNLSGGVGPFSYLWSNNAVTEDLSSVPPGTYTVTVTGNNQCTAIASVVVADNNIPINLSGNLSANTSCVSANGSLDLSVTPSGTYAFLWSNSAVTEDLSGIPAGTYTVTVSFGNCQSVNTFIVADNTNPPVLSENITASICGANNGAIDLTVSGATGPYSFVWDNGALTEDLSDLLPGNYAVTVTDANGCSSTLTLNVANNASNFSVAGASSDLTNCAANNGAIDLTITPAGAFDILWSNGAVTEDLTGLASGTYTVSVTEAGSTCTATASFFVVDQRTNPVSSQTVVPELCGQSDGAINLNVSGGTAPYNFLWSGGQISEDLTGIPAGTYSVTVTDANGCTTFTSSVIPGNTISFALGGSSAPNSSCTQNNGSIDLSVNPAGAYTFLWSNTAGTEDLSNLNAGTYTVTVTAVGNCTNTAVFNIGSDVPTPVLSDNITAAFCGQADGAIDLSVSGAPDPYTYQWSDASVGEDLGAIASGTYSVIVTAANGCSSTQSYNVPENSVTPTIGSTLTNASSCIIGNGAIDLNVAPVLAYTYAWSNGAVTEDLSNLTAGTYTVVVNGGGACTNSAVITIGSDAPSPLLADNITASFCGQADGAIDLSVSGAPGPYTYQWSDASAGEDLGAVSAGTYTVIVTAANGCSSTQTYLVPENSVTPTIGSTLTDATSCIIGNGAIDLNVTPALPYTFAWSNGAVTEDISNLASGTYTVVVNGGGACTNSAVITVGSNTGVVTLGGGPTAVSCFGENTGSIDLNITSGTAPFVYNWSAGVTGNPEDPANLASGTYTVTVTDANGCTNTSVFSITQPATALQLQCTPVNSVSEPGFTDGEGEVNIGGGTGPYTVNWAPGGTPSPTGAGNFPLQNLAENAYSVTVTDANGCPSTCGFSIGVAACATAIGSMSSAPLSICGPGCITANYDPAGQVLGANDLVQFVLHTGAGSQIVNEIARSSQPVFCFDQTLMSYGATYYISAVAGVSDANGNVNLNGFCSVSAAGTPVQFREIPVASALPPASLNCAVETVSLEGSSSLANAGFLWSSVNGSIVGNPAQATVTATSAGNYTLVATVNGCSDTTAVIVTDATNSPQASIAAGNTILDCNTTAINLNGIINGTANGAITWLQNGAVLGSGSTLNINTPGEYALVVLDSQTFCSDTAAIAITQDIAVPVLATTAPALLTCTTPSQTLTGSADAPGTQLVWAGIQGSDTTILSNGPSYVVNSAGTYYLLGTNPANGCSNGVSVTVSANQTPPVADAGNPFTLDCAGETAPLNGGNSSGGNLNYLWTSADGNFVSGASTATPLIDLPGTYVLQVTNTANGCTDTDQVTITPEIPMAFASVQHPTCTGEAGQIQVDSVTGLSNPILYSLNGGTPVSQTQFDDLQPGVYTVEVAGGNGCTASVTVEVETPTLVTLTLDPEAEVALGHSVQLAVQPNIPDSEIATVIWTPSEGLSCSACLDPIATPSTSTEYEVRVISDAGCEARGTIQVIVDRTRRVFAPNIFAPDGEAPNNIFTVFADPLSVVRIKSLQVYTRWGEAVYELNNYIPGDPALGWDGQFRGQKLNPGVFVWQAVIEFIDGKEELFKGDVTLMR